MVFVFALLQVPWLHSTCSNSCSGVGALRSSEWVRQSLVSLDGTIFSPVEERYGTIFSPVEER